MVSTLPADPAGFDLEFFSKGGPGSAPGSQGRKTSPKRCLRQNHSYIVHMVGLKGIVLGGTCIATDNACKLVINLIFNTIIYRIYIQYGYL